MTTYEFDILETRTLQATRPPPTSSSGWQLATELMAQRSRDGWELVDSTLSVNETIIDDVPRTESIALTVWRRPLTSAPSDRESQRDVSGR